MPTIPNWKKEKEKKERKEGKKGEKEKNKKTIKKTTKVYENGFSQEEFEKLEELEILEHEFWEAKEKTDAIAKKINQHNQEQQKNNSSDENNENSSENENDENRNEENNNKEESELEKNLGKMGMKNIKIIKIGGGKWGGPEQWMQFLLGGVALLFLFNFFSTEEIKEVPISEFMTEQKTENFDEISLSGDAATAKRSSGEKVKTIIGNRDSFKELGFWEKDFLGETKLVIKGKDPADFWIDLLISFLPLLLIMGLMIYSMKGMKGMGGFPFGGKKKGMEPVNPDTTFEDVAGQDEAKYELEEIVEFLKKPTQFVKMGAKIPKGVLLSGPPGTGKTLLARAVAGEAHVPFFQISGSEFVEMFVGVGASRVRGLFANARKHSPSIIFIDEIDAIGRKRSSGMGGGNDEREQTLNQILTEMDGFENETGIIVIGATNRSEILDNALMRPGRFDRQISVNNPTIKDREAILKVHSKGKPLDETVDLQKISARTVGFSGADLQNLMNESAIFAAREKAKTITNHHIDLAIDRIVMGTEKKSLIMSDFEKKMTAYHEVGHGLMGHLMPMTDPVLKITIVPRGRALGVTYMAPETESYHTTKQKYFEQICVLLGGLAAEKLIFEDTTSGVSNDLERASAIANAMVKKFGMSDEIGPVVYSDGGEESVMKKHSEAFAEKIDEEVQNILKKAYIFTQKTLQDNIQLLHDISKKLIEQETLSKDEFEEFFPDEKIEKTEKTEKTK